MTAEHDRLIAWESLPLPLRALGRDRVRMLWRWGSLPAPKLRSAMTNREFWSKAAIERWSRQPANAEWLRREGQRWRVLAELDAFLGRADRVGEVTP